MSAIRRVLPLLIDARIQARRTINCQLSSNIRCCSSTSKKEPIANQDIQISSDFYNRNPRALEFLGVAKKVKGWKYQYPPRNFYHRLVFERSNRHTSARVEHNTGYTVLSASTTELALAKHLHSLTDVSAAENIGRVLAYRCRQCGITNMTMLPPEASTNSQKFEKFEQAMTAGGIALWEAEEVEPDYQPGIDYDNKEEVENLLERQWKVHSLSEEHENYLKYRSQRPGSRLRKPPRPNQQRNTASSQE